MAYNTVCNNKNTALLILETIAEALKSDTQRAAIKAVCVWLENNYSDDISKLTPEERKEKIIEIETMMRDCMSAEQRKAHAAFYLDGIATYDAVLLAAPESNKMEAR